MYQTRNTTTRHAPLPIQIHPGDIKQVKNLSVLVAIVGLKALGFFLFNQYMA